MRIKTTNDRFGRKMDKTFWFFLTLFPLFGYSLYLFSINGSVGSLSFYAFMQNFVQIAVHVGNPVHKVFASIFGSSGLFPLFSDGSGLLDFFTYAVSIEILHVCFDVIVFIPRLAHKWISKAVQDD